MNAPQAQPGEMPTFGKNGGTELFQQSVNIAPRATGKVWLMLGGFLAFVVGFWGHQYWLANSGAVSIAASAHATPLVAPASKVSGIVGREAPARAQSVDGAAIASLANAVTYTAKPQAEIAIATDAPAAGAGHAVQNSGGLDESQAREMLRLRLALLREKAESALSKDRLTTPVNDNAVYYFREMLVLDGQNPVAEAGLMRVAERYRQFHRRLLARGDTHAAQNMWLQAKAIDPAGTLMVSDVEPAVESMDDSVQTTVNQTLPTPETAGQGVAQSEPARRALVLQRAREAVGAGRPHEAIELLSSELPQASTEGELVELLHQAFLNAGRSADASSLRISLRGALPGYRLARMQSGELLQQGKTAEAITALERNLPTYAEDSSYYGLLAGLYYKAQRYQDAAQAYEKLLALNPKLGSYWLGYAVALDAQGDARALQAFQRAAQTLSTNDVARDYVLQRVRELGQG